MRVGFGIDVHRYAPAAGAAQIRVGGIDIPFDHVIVAHSDGDVLIHALCDALLGAAALGDIGRHFPDSDPRYRAIDSRILLREVAALVTADGYRIGNIDAVLIAEKPRFAPFVEAMRTNLAEDLAIDVSAVSIKATTSEGLGFTGRGEGIAAQAVVLLE